MERAGTLPLRDDAQALAYWITAFSAAITSAWCVASAKWPASSMMIRRFFAAETCLKYASTSGVGEKRSCRRWIPYTENVCLDVADVVRDTPTILPKKIEDLREALHC
jgi:hypothetical protein